MNPMLGTVHSVSRQGLNDDGPSAVLHWDGRIDNRGELARCCRLPLNSEAVTDAALAGEVYEQSGVPGLRRIVGDWSAVIRDRRRACVVLARDFAGMRPLYYFVDATSIWWSPDLRAIAQSLGTPSLDDNYVAGFLVCGGYPGRSPYRGIGSVTPAHVVCISRDAVTTDRFWGSPTTLIRRRSPGEYEEQLRELFREAVAVRIRNARTVVAELSGGLDSSSVVCMADRLIREGAVQATQLTTLSYVHEPSPDTPYIAHVERACWAAARHLRTTEFPLFAASTSIGATPCDCSPILNAAALVAGQQRADAFLTGQAGDLLFGNWRLDTGHIASLAGAGRVGSALKEAWQWSRQSGVPVAHIFLQAAANLVAPRSRSVIAATSQAPDAMLAQASMTRRLIRSGLSDRRVPFSEDWIHCPVERRLHSRALTIARELGSLQPKPALQGFGYSHPILHRPLVEFLMAIPADVLCRPGEPRRLMRSALAFLWPEPLRRRRSKGLFGQANLQAYAPFALRLMTERRWAVVDHGWIDRESLKNRLERLTKGLECNQYQLRQVLQLESWLRHRELNACV
jgi:asparagine synthase (glutamine-hydrolysing)